MRYPEEEEAAALSCGCLIRNGCRCSVVAGSASESVPGLAANPATPAMQPSRSLEAPGECYIDVYQAGAKEEQSNTVLMSPTEGSSGLIHVPSEINLKGGSRSASHDLCSSRPSTPSLLEVRPFQNAARSVVLHVHTH
jgi:hypothetical protein